MSENLKDILSNLNPEIDQTTLMLYLQGKLSAQQQHEVEKQILDNDFESDALEGLQNFKDKKNLTALVHQLNTDLKKNTEKKKKQKEKSEIKLEPWLLIAIIVILIIAIISFVVVQKAMKG